MSTGTQEVLREEREPQESPGRRWLQAWLASLAFYYPAFWCSLFLLHVLPSLIKVMLFGERLKFLQLSLFTASAVSGPPALRIPTHYGQASDSQALLAAIFIAIAVAILLGFFGRAHRLLAGLTLALLGQAGLGTSLWPLFYRPARPSQAIVASTLFFGLMSLGLRWMLVAHRNAHYLARVGSLLADFVFPLALTGSIGAALRHGWFPRDAFSLLIPAVLASLLVSALPTTRFPAEPRQLAWRTVGAGLAATAFFVAAVALGGQRATRGFARARVADNQLAMARYPRVAADLPFPKIFFQRGVNFTAEFPDVYASEGARQMLEALPQYGVNAIALVPYGWSSAHPPRVVLPRQGQSWESDEGIEELSRVAHALGIKVLLKPAVWQADQLNIPSAIDRAVWFDQYRQFLDHYTQLAKTTHADVFCIGGELVHLTAYDSEWRKLISHVRQSYPGPLVYAANFGNEFEHVAFWDALDYIGLQEYYSLPDDLDLEPIVQKVEEVQQKYRRPVIFTEVGFPSLAGANHQPWDDSPHTPISLPAQAACYEAVFRAFYHQPWFEGMYWWKIETNGSGGPHDNSHTPWGKPAMEVIKHWYGSVPPT